MRYEYFNPNPKRSDAIDCVVRAICRVKGIDWKTAFMGVCLEGLELYDMPSSNHVWGRYLKKEGFERYGLPNDCPDCYTVEQFCMEHPTGMYVLATGGHVVAVVDGVYYDTWNSGDRVIDFFWYKEA